MEYAAGNRRRHTCAAWQRCYSLILVGVLCFSISLRALLLLGYMLVALCDAQRWPFLQSGNGVFSLIEKNLVPGVGF